MILLLVSEWFEFNGAANVIKGALKSHTLHRFDSRLRIKTKKGGPRVCNSIRDFLESRRLVSCDPCK